MRRKHEDVEVPYKDFDVMVGFALEKQCKINTDDYGVVFDDFEKEAWEDTSNTDWARAYEESHYTIPELLHELEQYVKKEMQFVEPCSGRGRELKRILNDVQGWEQIDSCFDLQ